MAYTNNDPGKTDMLSTINIGIGCTMVGISQFSIGLALNQEGDHGTTDEFISHG